MFHFQTDWLWRPTSQNCVAQIQILRYFSWLYIHYNKIKLPLEIMGKIYINIAYSNSTTNKQKFRLPLMCLKHDGHRKSYLIKCRISKAENERRSLTYVVKTDSKRISLYVLTVLIHILCLETYHSKSVSTDDCL